MDKTQIEAEIGRLYMQLETIAEQRQVVINKIAQYRQKLATAKEPKKDK